MRMIFQYQIKARDCLLSTNLDVHDLINQMKIIKNSEIFNKMFA